MSFQRLSTIQGHLLSGKFNITERYSEIEIYRNKGKNLNAAQIRDFFFGSSRSEFDEMLGAMQNSPIFNHIAEIEMNREQKREVTLDQMIELNLKFPLNSRAGPLEKLKLSKAMAYYKLDLYMRQATHFSQYVDAIELLGTEKHASAIQRAYGLQDIGCLGISELGAIQISADFDSSTREFILNSSEAAALKWMVGGAAQTANTAVIFARTLVNGQDQGLNAFLLPLRDYQTHALLQGVIIGDIGYKSGAEGLDHGFIRFSNFRVPQDALLDKFAKIDATGQFSSPLTNDQRFQLTHAVLNRSRLSTTYAGTAGLHNALTIAIRYGAIRRQFKATSDQEELILDYPLHRFRLIPHLARTMALNAALQYVEEFYSTNYIAIMQNPVGAEAQAMMVYLSMLKPMAGWYAAAGIQECREACGGLGFSSYTLIGKLKTHNDILLSWEDDGNVFIQESAKYALRQLALKQAGKKVEMSDFEYLEPDFNKLMATKANFTSIDELTNDKLLEALQFRASFLAHRSQGIIDINMKRYNNERLTEINSLVFGTKDLGIAVAEALMAKELFRRASTVQDRNSQEILTFVARLFCAYSIEKANGYLFESYITADHIRTIRVEVLRLCKHVGDHSLKLIDALAIPDKVLGSVLGQSDGQAYINLINAVEAAPGVYDPPVWTNWLVKVRDEGVVKK